MNKCPYCHSHISTDMDPAAQAKAEVAREQFRNKVEECKTKLRSKKPWFPFRIRLERIA